MSTLNDGIIRLYDTVFDRAPDADGFRFWTDAADHGTSLATMANLFITAPEFAATYGQPDSTSFVQSMYNNVLDRPGEAEGVSFWVCGLDHGLTSRADVVVAFSESAEHIAHMSVPMPLPSPVTPIPVPDPVPALPADTTALPETQPGPYTLTNPMTGVLYKTLWTHGDNQTLVGGAGHDEMYGLFDRGSTMWGRAATTPWSPAPAATRCMAARATTRSPAGPVTTT